MIEFLIFSFKAKGNNLMSTALSAYLGVYGVELERDKSFVKK